MTRRPRYLPDGDYVPRNWPNGTGITLYRTPDTPDDRVAIAEAIASFGCHPAVALKAADEILQEGDYSTRVATSTAMTISRTDYLDSVGIATGFEKEIPDGNSEHIRHPRNRNRRIDIKEPPLALIREMLDRALKAEQNVTSPGIG